MVYNTTENSTSISIDLTPGVVYSVTVAGRDGAGRLGENISKELLMELPEAIGMYTGISINLVFTSTYFKNCTLYLKKTLYRLCSQ